MRSFWIISLAFFAPASAQGLDSTGIAWADGFLDTSWPAMSLALGLVDGINPCAMWTLLILIGALLNIENIRHRWLIGTVFVASSGIIYFAALLAYLIGFHALSQWFSKAMPYLFPAVAILAIVAGSLMVLKSGKKDIHCEVRDPASRKNFREKIQEILVRENFWLILLGVVFLAFSVNAFELLCSFAIPTVFTTTLSALSLDWWEKISALILYDLAYMVDDILVLVIALKTLSLKIFSPRVVRISSFIGGFLLIFLGILILMGKTSFLFTL